MKSKYLGGSELWVAGYEDDDHNKDLLIIESDTNIHLIDSIYDLLLWCMNEGYLKFE